MTAAIKDMVAQHPPSPWRLKALIAVANRYLLVNRPDEYVPLYKAAYECFPSAPAAALCHWKVTFHEYLRGAGTAGDLLAEHLRNYGGHNPPAPPPPSPRLNSKSTPAPPPP